MKEVYVYDIEIYQNFFSVTFLNINNNEIKQFYIYDNINQLKELIDFLLNNVSGLIGFNNLNYEHK